MNAASEDRPHGLTDSHWFWGQLFSVMALAGTLLIAPKFDVRQRQVEGRFLGRQAAATERQQAAGPRCPFEFLDRLTDRHPQPLTGAGHKPPKPRERQTGTRSAPTHENHRRWGIRGVLANRRRTADTPNLAAPQFCCSRTVRQPEGRCGSAIGRAILWR
jgi:hypothetical protein